MSVTQLFEGKVTEIEEPKQFNHIWLVVRVRGKQKPLGIYLPGFTGTRPTKGDRISVQAKEGDRWWFAQHRSIVITKDPQPHADYITAPKDLMEELEKVVLDELDLIEQVTSDDVHDEILARAGDSYSPKIVGMVFGSLAKKRKIHKVGRMKTRRPKGHAREVAVWERTIKK